MIYVYPTGARLHQPIVVNTYSLSNDYNFVVEHINQTHHPLHPNKRKSFQAEQSELFR